MRRIRSILVFMVLALTLTGCGNKNYNKFIEEGKLALAGEEYDKAKNMFVLADSEKDNKSKEAQNLIKQVDTFMNINNEVKKDEVMTSDRANDIITLCDEIIDNKEPIKQIYDKTILLKEDYIGKKEVLLKNENYIKEGLAKIDNLIKENKMEEAKKEASSLYNDIVSMPKDYHIYLDEAQEVIDKVYNIISNRHEDERNKDIKAELIKRGFTPEKALENVQKKYEGDKELYSVMGAVNKIGSYCYEVKVKTKTFDGFISTGFTAYAFEDGKVLDQYEVN